MNKFYGYVAALFLVCPLYAAAETLTPKKVTYDFEREAEDGTIACRILATAVNIPAPEGVNLKLLSIGSLSRKEVYVGLSVDLVDLKYSNGNLAGVDHVPLKRAAYSSATFNSIGRLNGGTGTDGSVFLSTNDAQTGGVLIRSFIAGNFQLSFYRESQTHERTYVFPNSVPNSVVRRFQDCTQAMLQALEKSAR